MLGLVVVTRSLFKVCGRLAWMRLGMRLCRVGFPHYFPGSCVCLGVPRSLDWWLFLELAMDLVSEVREALRKSGGFVFGDRLPLLAIFTRGTLSQAS